MKIEFDGVRDFDAEDIFECGQCFRWNRESDGTYTGIASGHAANVFFDAGTLVITTADDEADGAYGSGGARAFWERYFDLGRDYGEIKETLTATDKIMEEAVKSGPGIRILRQDEWETLVSFIVSQNNNIPRIKKCIEALADAEGVYAGEVRGRAFRNIPSPEALACAADCDMDTCRLGYRKGFLMKTAAAVAADGAQTLYSAARMTREDAREYLLSLPGVGPKVADCILLFSMEKYSSFPIDVWVRRVMSELYGLPENDVRGMAAFAESSFGEYGGFAQQYLFNYMRKRG